MKSEKATDYRDMRNAADRIERLVNEKAVLERSYKCFHCKQAFTDEGLAQQHFGDHTTDLPLCIQYARSGSGGGPHDPYIRLKKSALSRIAAALSLLPDAGVDEIVARAEAISNPGISHADICALSQVFNQTNHWSVDQRFRVNEWLKKQIGAALDAARGRE